jgi:hypothetical protein
MKKIILTTSIAIATASILFVSCSKKKDTSTTATTTTPDYSTATEVNTSQSDFDDIHKLAQDAMSSNGQLRIGATSPCGLAKLSNDSIVITYGTYGISNCIGTDLRARQGQLIITFTGRYTTPGTVITIKTNNYVVNGRKIQGMRTITNNGPVSGDTTFTIVDSDTSGVTGSYAKITQTDGKVGTWRSTRTRAWTAGSATPADISDDIYIVNGTGNGISSGGVTYSLTATNIELKLSCWASYLFAPVSGILSLTSPDGTRSLDYGDGTCDNTAIFTYINGKTYTITL